jgi:hypothetical protein
VPSAPADAGKAPTLTKPAGDPVAGARAVSSSSVPIFDPAAPPRDWERQHAAPRGRLILGVETWNQGARPVPHLASHHYADNRIKFRLGQGNATFYFA